MFKDAEIFPHRQNMKFLNALNFRLTVRRHHHRWILLESEYDED